MDKHSHSLDVKGINLYAAHTLFIVCVCVCEREGLGRSAADGHMILP